MSGRQFIQSPGPTNIPDSVLEAFRRPAVDFGGPEFAELVDSVFHELPELFGGAHRVVMHPSVGHGSWEATLVNLLEPGARILLPASGLFSMRWVDMANDLGFRAESFPVDLRRAPDPAEIHARLAADSSHEIKAVLVAHVETSTGTLADLAAVRQALDDTGHPALLVVDAIASFGTEWIPMSELGLDAVLAASQKGLMMPPGLSLIGLSERAVEIARTGGSPRSYWRWAERFEPKWTYQRFGGTPPEQHLYAFRAALDLIAAEGGIQAVATRHRRFATAVHRTVEAWGKEGPWELNVTDPAERASSVTCIRSGDLDADTLRIEARDRYNVVIGGGMLELAGRAFRIGHLGDLNEPMLLGALGGIELSMAHLGLPHGPGVRAAIEALAR
ncbi:MAG: aminotransferase class V-fold PLP-dependent enzyme [Actinomycetia bacterium]|nr:aminotransferase class V-fold PLP-dependent enzyme [Actinomycetes bacterium]